MAIQLTVFFVFLFFFKPEYINFKMAPLSKHYYGRIMARGLTNLVHVCVNVSRSICQGAVLVDPLKLFLVH